MPTISSPSPGRFAWLVVSLLFAASVFNYMDRTALSIVQPQVRKDLALSNTDYGLVLDAFLVAYAILYIVGGWLADRLGYRHTFSLTVICWSAAKMLHSCASGLLSLGLFRALLGAAEGGFYPTALRGSAEWFPPATRSKAIGVVLCGLSVGALITPPVVTSLTACYGWRAAFLVTGAVGFLLVPPWWLLHRRIRQVFGRSDPAPGLRSASDERPDENGLSLTDVLRRRKYWCILIARVLTDVCWWFLLFWIAPYFQDERGFTLEMVGWWLWVPFLGADLGSLAGGWLAAMLIQRGLSKSAGRKVVLVPGALLGALASLAYFVDSPAWAIALLSVAFFGHFSCATNVHTAISEISPKRHQAVLYGITGAAGTLASASTQPAIGYVVDRGWYLIPFVCVGAAYLLAVAAIFAVGRIEPLAAE